MSISGDNVIIGQTQDLELGQETGSAYIYHFDGTNWVEQQKLTPSDAIGTESFGISVAISGNDAVIGAPGTNDNGVMSGSAYIYHFDGTNWMELQKLLPAGTDSSDWLGRLVSLSGDTTIIGAPGASTGSGSAYLFRRTGTLWEVQHVLIASDGTINDSFGESVSVSGNNVIIGASDDDNGTGSGSAYIYNGSGTSTTYSDGEDLTTDGWLTHDNYPAVATITNVNDLVKGSRVIELSGDGIMNAYSLQNSDGSPWDNASQFNLDMAVNFSEHFAVIVKVETAQGLRLLTYSPVDTNGLGGKVYLNYGLGTGMADGSWQTISRDLAADLAAAQPGNTIQSIKGIIIRGSGRVDDISLQ